ncbi:acidic skeletal organic matrix protein-like [Leptopilina boulardi]|uniref:acidic skeletal organic matrix protein-like n=1 Tax=Leptopilina boulardi TaxID=63433 RepID=UPI0021F5C448|nr:acidic skeletal organic matrix protein-like [Leptopilina boulardi]
MNSLIESLCVTAVINPKTGGMIVREEDQFILCEVLKCDGTETMQYMSPAEVTQVVDLMTNHQPSFQEEEYVINDDDDDDVDDEENEEIENPIFQDDNCIEKQINEEYDDDHEKDQEIENSKSELLQQHRSSNTLAFLDPRNKNVFYSMPRKCNTL